MLGRYSLIRRLGTGGFGTVWLARDERLERDVAVKILPRERIVGGRFEREARAAARLSHPGIVTLYEATIDDDGAYLVSELVRGWALSELLAQGRLSDRDILEIAIALTEALAHAHAQGVVHRDVKPSNILIPERPTSPTYPAKLTDFGVARVVGGDCLTRTGDVVGTEAYMAPEQAEGREAGAPADLYGLALVVYEALTGVNPIRTTGSAARARRLGAHLPPLRRQRRELPPELGAAIDLALRPKPRERGTLEELREALRASLDQVGDAPGIVTSAWSRGQSEVPDARADERRGTFIEQPRDNLPDDEPPVRLAWPARALAAAGAAGVTAWLAAHLLTPLPVAPAALAVIAWLLVLLLPRLGWIVVSIAIAGAAVAQHRPGGALLVLLAAALPALLMPLSATSWPLAAGAPALGLAGLAGAWPALAARATRSAWRRAALGLLGYTWVVLASPLAGRDLYGRRPPGTPASDAWTLSLSTTAHDVIRPIVTSGVLAAAPVWALAALVLPWLVSPRSLALEVVLVTVWAAVTVSASETAIALTHHGARAVTPPTAVAGALLGALVALGPSIGRAWRVHRSSVQLP